MASHHVSFKEQLPSLEIYVKVNNVFNTQDNTKMNTTHNIPHNINAPVINLSQKLWWKN